MPLLYFEIQNHLADGRKMLAAEWERNRNTRVFHNFADSAGVPRKQNGWRQHDKVRTSFLREQ